MIKLIPSEELQMALVKRAFDSRYQYYPKLFYQFHEMWWPREAHLGTVDGIRIAREYLIRKGKV